ncbi:MAG: hypothetical protein HRT36_00670 [Alphaproteobacteria bacterium]|nr:hypothetical protein [Alphaproteobacteria bacterium]
MRLGKAQLHGLKSIQPQHLPTFTRVLFKDNEQAKALGVKWDQQHKSYYISS